MTCHLSPLCRFWLINPSFLHHKYHMYVHAAADDNYMRTLSRRYNVPRSCKMRAFQIWAKDVLVYADKVLVIYTNFGEKFSCMQGSKSGPSTSLSGPALRPMGRLPGYVASAYTLLCSRLLDPNLSGGYTHVPVEPKCTWRNYLTKPSLNPSCLRFPNSVA